MVLRTLLFVLCTNVLLRIGTCHPSRQIAYPMPRPDSIPMRFLPEVIPADKLHFCTAFSADGKKVFFCRGERGVWQIYELALGESGKSIPRLAPFSEASYSQADPFVTADGTLYFISNRPVNATDTIADYNIWRTRPEGEGKWSAPEYIEQVNSDSTEYYVSVARNGNLYFASNRRGGYGGLDLYVSEVVNGAFTTPKNLGAMVNTTGDEHDPLITAHEDYLVFTSDRPGGYGEADLYYAKQSGGQWSYPAHMSNRINTATYEYCPSFSPDGQYFYYSSELTIKWMESKYLPFTPAK
ncbi:PD40 domain-containing protein [Chitinophaga pendula]|uniref:PD40 domain-containing protein n=1 Tax=Chitinophaga TaxID=79328 RepID=UPI000BB0692A|nr:MULTISPECIES: PD40 domain-containing protein [Chitinophaga]ASZ11709.1 hypothetical protein CK934_12440 [Chitinophaga sp. MD30]UCJ05273.1 PD40 domain-containing protein [Chitinophaga pendula]